MTLMRITPLVLLACTAVVARAETFLRWNQAGYAPERPKVVLAMSERDLAGQSWTVSSGDEIVLRGEIAASVAPAGPHTPLAFNHAIDLSALREPGRYELRVPGTAPAAIRIARDPYRELRELPLHHLRFVRSGSHEARLRAYSHPGDARAIVHVVDGDPANGKWKPATPARTVDVTGGWYDAGDQIKFTLNNSYTTYHLLLAYRLKPDAFGRSLSRSELPDILDEARHGLEFLMRVFPDENTFVIQVADATDHNQPARLPEHDALDGKRPALCALSRVHMASASAALALGARTFREIGRADDAVRYEAQARAIFARAQKPDTILSAFERDQVNDFYHDDSEDDQLALAAAELHALTGEHDYLGFAKRHTPPPAPEVSWGDWNWVANAALASHHAPARQSLLDETGVYVKAAQSGGPWGIPGRYVWGSLHRWTGIANAAGWTALKLDVDDGRRAVFRDVLDYAFGRNNWGVSFLFTESLPNTLRHLYSPAYELLKAFPTGAFSEGPGNRSTHESLTQYFSIPADDPFRRFNTPTAVFYDNSTDFMCQEATITGQADAILLFTLALLLEEKS